MGVSGPYVTEIIDSLEEAGWAKRIVKRPDRRMTRVRLTPVGRERCGRLVPAVMQYMVDSVASLTPAERDQLTHLASKVHAALSEAQDDMFADAKGIMLGR
jgi:DNA-binding MarR family transcriptional regulator